MPKPKYVGMGGYWGDDVALDYQQKPERGFGYTEFSTNTGPDRAFLCQKILAKPDRDGAWPQANFYLDERGNTLHYPTEPVITVDGGQARCYLPALGFCAGLRNLVPSMMKRILVDATTKDINMAIRSAGLVFVRLEWAGDYHGLLSRASGAYIIGGQVNSHPHWVGLNAFKGAMAMGNGTVRFMEASDLSCPKRAKAFFADAGFDHITEIYVLRAVALKKNKKKRKRGRGGEGS